MDNVFFFCSLCKHMWIIPPGSIAMFLQLAHKLFYTQIAIVG